MVLTCKTLIPAALIIALGLTVGIEGIFGVSILALLTIFGNSNGALWLAFAGEYGDERDTGAYVASAFDDGPFLALIFLGAAGLGEIPLIALLAAIVPFVLGLFVGAVDREWTRVLEHVPTITIPFMSFAVGAGINLGTVLRGGLDGLFLGLAVVGFTGGLTYLGYRFVLRRGPKSGIGFAAGTTAGNAVAVPAVVAVADPASSPSSPGDRAGRDRRPGHRCARPHRRVAGAEEVWRPATDRSRRLHPPGRNGRNDPPGGNDPPDGTTRPDGTS